MCATVHRSIPNSQDCEDSMRLRLTRAKRKAAALMKGDGKDDQTRTLA